MRNLTLLACLIFISLTRLSAQVPANAFKDTRIALYVSQRGLNFNGAYTILFGSYVSRQDTLGVIEEDLERGVSIKLGTFVADALPRYLGARGTVFVNAEPELGMAFVRANQNFDRTGTRLNMVPSRGLMAADTKYVLVIDELELHTDERVAVYSISNRIVSEKRIARLGRIRLKLYDVNTGTLTADVSVNYDEEKSPNQHAYFRLPDGSPAAEVFFTRVLNSALAELFRKLAAGAGAP